MWKGSELVKSLALDFTQKCNLSCDYCYLYSKQDIQKAELPTEDLINNVNKCLDLFPSIDSVELWGGESTYDPERLYLFCKSMYDRGIKTWIPSTNGTLIHDYKHYEAWRYCNQKDTSQISFDGNPKYHNKHRSNSFDRVVENMKLALREQVPISVRTTYSFKDFVDSIKENIIWYPKLYQEFLDDDRLNSELVDRTFACQRYKNKKFMMIYQEIDTIFPKEETPIRAQLYRKYYQSLRELVLSQVDNEIIFLPPYINDTIQALLDDKPIEPKSCGSFFTQLYLHTPSGDIYPCLSQDVSAYQDIAKLANINTMEINWPVVNTVRTFMLRRNKACRDCLIQPSCFGACYHRTPDSDKYAFNSYWNTANITKCIFAHYIFDIVVETSQALLNLIDQQQLSH
jgi:radical SAM protein with 4Fe4S-binding SPASM domain